MKQKSLEKWLKIVIIGVTLCGAVTYALILPSVGEELVLKDPTHLQRYYLPWLIFLWLSAIPSYGILILSWKIAGHIGRDNSFSIINAKLLKNISVLAAGIAAYLFVGNIVLFVLGMNHPGILLYFIIIEFVGIAVSILSATLSHLVMKAAELQEQSDGTI